jgi:serine/threonine protein kinase
MTSQDPTDPIQEATDAPRQAGRREPGLVPDRVDRYRIERLLGEGGFGVVYLAQDEQLDRLVAVKIAHPELMAHATSAAAYLHEARVVAGLDHPHIVPLYDVGSTDEVPFYSVSKFISGTDLSVKMRQFRFHPADAAQMVATIADALHFAHKQGLVHRDVKPGNILIDEDGKPYLVDFGLALREADLREEPQYVGTPVYTSPEQARGEGHRIDGRSDIFSLGVVFYELLTRKRPFRGSTRRELLRQVASLEPKPPRQYSEQIPKELERICQKAMAKMARDRYSSAFDLAADLKHFLSTLDETDRRSRTTRDSLGQPADTEVPTTPPSESEVKSSDSPPFVSSGKRQIRIVPKGIRSFDVHDADFFLKLLPGAVDRDGLPDSIRFWKARIEERDAEKTFSVGLIYGPSGCGKSSLVNAGLLPRLSPDITVVTIEAAPDSTETRLLRAIRKSCPTLPSENSLVETVKTLRMGFGPSSEKKILIVIDQFEQWLHTSGNDPAAELVQALRQCDGSRVQCIVMVRDDFWMATTEFMRQLEIRIAEGQNSAAVDLFPSRHAIKVLDAFGRAFGALPDETQGLNDAQTAFLSQAVEELSTDHKVICVRLSLFAEIMRGKTWDPETLRNSGGAKGVGATFLEETFSASTAAPENRYHQRAARKVLAALLPPSGTNIRGHMRSYEELKSASGYEQNERDFDELLTILDSEIRLITPTDPDGIDEDELGHDSDNPRRQRAHRYFQLTHDYLVPSLRGWLTQKQSETRRGRAELLLAERASVWNTKQENRYLPTLTESIRIRLLTDRQQWTEPQQEMIRRAGRVHGRNATGVIAMAAILVAGAWGIRSHFRREQAEATAALERQARLGQATTLIEGLTGAEISGVKAIAEAIEPYRSLADPILVEKLEAAPIGSGQRLRLSLALLPVDPSQQDYLVEQLPTLSIRDFPYVRDELPGSPRTTERLWTVAEDETRPASQRFQACCALATYAPDAADWSELAPFVVDFLAGSVPSHQLGDRLDQLQPVKAALTAPLNDVLEKTETTDLLRREAAAIALAQYLTGGPMEAADSLLLCRHRREFHLLVETLRPDFSAARDYLSEILTETPPFESVAERDANLRRRAIAAALLVHFGDFQSVLPRLSHSSDPSLRSYIASFFQPLPIPAESLLEAAEQSDDVSVLRVVVQGIGYLDVESIAQTRRENLLGRLRDLYANHVDPGIHSVSAWAIERWNADLPELQASNDIGRTPEELEQLAETHRQIALIEQQIQAAVDSRAAQQEVWERELAKLPSESADDDGLQLRLRLDQPESGTQDDEILSQAFESSSAPPVWRPGILGDALQTDGVEGIACGEVANMDAGKPFSYGCWFLSDDPNQYAGLISKMDGRNDEYRGFDIWLHGGRVSAHLNEQEPTSNLKVIADSPYAAGQWHHVMVTYTGNRRGAGVKLYLDGQLVPSKVDRDSLTGNIDTDAPFVLGGRYDAFPFRGSLDDVRVYDRVIEPEEISNLFRAGLATVARIAPADRQPQQQALLDHTHEQEVTAPLVQLLSRLQASVSSLRWEDKKLWYVNGQDQVMIVIPIERMPAAETLDHDFAIGAHEVTIDQYFRSGDQINIDDTTAPTTDCPMHNVSWYEVTAYCNWLSEQEGIPEDQWCFEPNANGDYGDGMRIKENYRELAGYRLPTHAEWEVACRVGATTDYFFGSVNELVDNYLWYGGNSSARSHPVGQLLPNDFGIFDLHGNTWEWALDVRGSGQWTDVRGDLMRDQYSGSFSQPLGNVQARANTHSVPSYRSNFYGFRVARSIP